MAEKRSPNDLWDEPPNKKRANQWAQKFKDDYLSIFPTIRRSSKGDYFAFCSTCDSHFNIAHGGKNDCRKHVQTKKHKDLCVMDQSTSKISSYFTAKDQFSESDHALMNAEVLFNGFVVEHHLPFAVADHASKLFSKMFPDSKIASNYSCARSKTTAIVHEMAEMKKEDIFKVIKDKPFSVATDGSSDVDLKQYPVLVRYFSDKDSAIVTHVLAVPTCEERATGENIFRLLESTLDNGTVPFQNVLSLGCDNANVMTGKHKGVNGFLLRKQPQAYCSGCPCHLIHLAAEKSAKKLKGRTDDLLIDIYYYMEKSSLRKETLKKFQGLYGMEQFKVLRHACTRWLSLGKCLDRLLILWDPLKDFFQAEEKDSKKNQSETRSEKLSDKKKSDNKGDAQHSVRELFSSSDVTVAKSGEKGKGTKKLGERTERKEKTDSSKKSHESSEKKMPEKKDKVNKEESKKDKGDTKEDKGDSSRNKQPERLQRINRCMRSLEFKLESLFLKTTIPLFDQANLKLQEEEPLIHKTRKILHKLMRGLLLRFVKPSALANKTVTMVSFTERVNQKDDSDLVVWWFACFRDPESYSSRSLHAPGRGTQAGQVDG